MAPSLLQSGFRTIDVPYQNFLVILPQNSFINKTVILFHESSGTKTN